jgi:hypothetical protein
MWASVWLVGFVVGLAFAVVFVPGPSSSRRGSLVIIGVFGLI